MCQQKTCLPILRRLQNTDSHPERFIRREFFPCLPKYGRDVERFFLFRHSGFREQDWAENEAGTFIRCHARIEVMLRDVSVPVPREMSQATRLSARRGLREGHRDRLEEVRIPTERLVT